MATITIDKTDPEMADMLANCKTGDTVEIKGTIADDTEESCTVNVESVYPGSTAASEPETSAEGETPLETGAEGGTEEPPAMPMKKRSPAVAIVMGGK